MDDASRVHFSSLSDQSIGAILVSVGRLSPEDTERIFQEQKKKNIRFGEAALALGLATEADIQFALSHQFRYPYLLHGESKVSEAVVAAYNPFSPQVEALRALRSQLMMRWFGDAEHKALAIVSPDREEGRSWLAANLAVVFSQLGARTLLIDTDLRNPSLHKLFGINNRNGLSSILGGRATGTVVFRIPSLLDLSVLPSGPVPPNPQELISRSLLDRMLQQLANSFDIILIDTPPASMFAESVAVAARVGGAFVVSKRNQSRLRALDELCGSLRDANVMIVGSVLNDYKLTGNSRKAPDVQGGLPATAWGRAAARLKSSASVPIDVSPQAESQNSTPRVGRSLLSSHMVQGESAVTNLDKSVSDKSEVD